MGQDLHPTRLAHSVPRHTARASRHRPLPFPCAIVAFNVAYSHRPLRRKLRGEGFHRLVGITDNRGPRGWVAVAERAGGRVRLLHYAPSCEPFYATELTQAHRSVQTNEATR